MPVTQVDTSVTIPAAIRAAGAQADDMIKQLTQSADAPVEPAAPASPDPAAPPQDSAPAVDPAPPVPEETWEKRHNSLRGRHERVVSQLRDANARIQDLEARVTALQSHTADAPALSDDPLISEDEIKDYGPEFMNLVERKVLETVRPLVRRHEAQVSELEAKLGGNSRQTMLNSLNEQLPNWVQINNQPEFLEWLALPDPYTGVIRHQQLLAAFEQNKFPQVLAFFKGFLATEAALDPAALPREPAAPAAPNGVQPAGKLPLEALAAPGRAKSGASATPPEKPVITTADITAFYADVNRGKYRGREKEQREFEQELALAQREGRVRP